MFRIALKKKKILSHKNICFKAIQNACKSNRVSQAWTEVCHEIFGGWEVQTMWNLEFQFFNVPK